MTWLYTRCRADMKQRSVNPRCCISRVSNKPAEATLSLRTHAQTTNPVRSSLCSVSLIGSVSHRWAPIQEPQWLDESRPGSVPRGISGISESLLLSPFGSSFWIRAWILAVVLIWLDLRAPPTDHKFKMQTWFRSPRTVSKRAASPKVLKTIVVYIDILALICTHRAWHFRETCIVSHHYFHYTP